ncbi:MAG: glycosyltransferase family 2 protein [Rhizobiaceae bacterium]
MLTVLIETLNDEETLPLTLASLIPAVIEGVVREVIVCDRGSTDRTDHVAEHAGCGYLASGGLAAGARAAKGEWLVVMEPGARLVEGWMDGVLAHISAGPLPARFGRARDEAQPLLSRLFARRRPLAEGLLIPKGQALALLRGHADAHGLARAAAAKRLSGARIRPAVKKG